LCHRPAVLWRPLSLIPLPSPTPFAKKKNSAVVSKMLLHLFPPFKLLKSETVLPWNGGERLYSPAVCTTTTITLTILFSDTVNIHFPIPTMQEVSSAQNQP
jgi:hypothetical protein